MSRMEKYHQKKETDSPSELSHDQSNQELIEPFEPSSKAKKTNKRFFKWLGIIFGILILFSLISFYIGKKGADLDKEFKKVTVTDFNGQKSSDGSTNVLLLGSDSRGEDLGRTDAIMVAHYNKKEKTPKLLSFMRDTYVDIPGQGYNKLNAAYAFGGPELVRQTLKNTFGIDVQYYAVVNFSAFANIIDSLSPGGLKIDVEKDMTVDGEKLTKGVQKLDGHDVLQYARFRKDTEGDFGRVRRQQQVLNALTEQSLSVFNSIHFPKAIGQALGYTSTNIPTSLLPSLLIDGLFGRVNGIEKLTVPVENSWWDSDYPDAGSVLEIDVGMNNEAIYSFLNNK